MQLASGRMVTDGAGVGPDSMDLLRKRCYKSLQTEGVRCESGSSLFSMEWNAEGTLCEAIRPHPGPLPGERGRVRANLNP